jgi:hypothetical protein
MLPPAVAKTGGARRPSKGIRLAKQPNLVTEIPPTVSLATLPEPMPVSTPAIAQPAIAPASEEARPATPPALPKLSLPAMVRAQLRNTPRWALATLAALAVIGLVETQYGKPAGEAAPLAAQAPAVAGPYGEPPLYAPNPYQAAVYRPYAGPTYGGPYIYRDGPGR